MRCFLQFSHPRRNPPAEASAPSRPRHEKTLCRAGCSRSRANHTARARSRVPVPRRTTRSLLPHADAVSRGKHSPAVVVFPSSFPHHTGGAAHTTRTHHLHDPVGPLVIAAKRPAERCGALVCHADSDGVEKGSPHGTTPPFLTCSLTPQKKLRLRLLPHPFSPPHQKSEILLRSSEGRKLLHGGGLVYAIPLGGLPNPRYPSGIVQLRSGGRRATREIFFVAKKLNSGPGQPGSGSNPSRSSGKLSSGCCCCCCYLSDLSR
jgi:hypothetical protein